MTTYTLNLFFDPNHERCKKGRFLPYPTQEEISKAPHTWEFNFYSKAWIKKTDERSYLIGEDNAPTTDFTMKPGDKVQIVLGIAQSLNLQKTNVAMTVMCARSTQDESDSESSPFRLPVYGLVTPLSIFNTPVSIIPEHPGYTDWWMLDLGVLAEPVSEGAGTRKIELMVGMSIAFVDPNTHEPRIYQLTHDPVMQVDEKG